LGKADPVPVILAAKSINGYSLVVILSAKNLIILEAVMPSKR